MVKGIRFRPHLLGISVSVSSLQPNYNILERHIFICIFLLLLLFKGHLSLDKDTRKYNKEIIHRDLPAFCRCFFPLNGEYVRWLDKHVQRTLVNILDNIYI